MSALGRHGGWPCPAACAASHHSCVPKPTSLFPSSSASFRASPVTKAPTSGDGPPVLRIRLWLRATRTALRRLAQCRPQRGFPSKRLRLGGREPRAQGPALQTPGVAGLNPGPHQTHTGDRRPPRGGARAADMTATAVAWPPPASALGPGCVRLPCGRRAGRGGVRSSATTVSLPETSRQDCSYFTRVPGTQTSAPTLPVHERHARVHEARARSGGTTACD